MVRRTAPKKSAVALGYIRMSTGKQELSPAAQGNALARWAEKTGAHIVAIYFDLGVSGTKDADESVRPGLATAIARLKDHGATVLVAAKEDRLARDTDIAGYIGTMVKRAGARVVTVDGSEDLFRRDIDRAFAAEEGRRIRIRTKTTLAVKRARGERLGGQVPYGYQRKADGGHVVRDGFKRCGDGCAGCLRVEENPAEQAVIAQAMALSESGLSVRAITAKMNGEGARNRSGKPFAFQSVYDLLRPRIAEAG